MGLSLWLAQLLPRDGAGGWRRDLGTEGLGCQDLQMLMQSGHPLRRRDSEAEIIFVSAVKKSFVP